MAPQTVTVSVKLCYTPVKEKRAFTMNDLNDYRKQIDDIDRKITELFQQRMETAGRIGEIKRLNGAPIRDEKRENEIIEARLEQVEEKWQPYFLRFQKNLFELSRDYQKSLNAQQEELLNNHADFSPYSDAAFKATNRAHHDRQLLADATIGSLHDEQGRLFILDSVYQSYEEIDERTKAGYADHIEGSDQFNQAVFSWLNRLDNLHLPHRCVATPGGTGAVFLPLANSLESGQHLLIPEISWGAYRTMAATLSLEVATYPLLEDDQLSLNGLMQASLEIMEHQKRLTVIINDPCHNPIGLSMGKENWQKLITFFNKLSQQGPVTIINDVAYLDYCHDPLQATDYLSAVNAIEDNVAFCIAFSCSKSLTGYGMRLGDCVILTRHQQQADHLFSSYCRMARSIWSSVNNGFMNTFVRLMDQHKQQYLEEKQQAIAMLKKRSDLFLSQARQAGLAVLPYQEGFFISLPLSGRKAEQCIEALEAAHIYCVPFGKAIRIAICSLTLTQIDGLAFRIREVLDQI